MHSKNNFKSYTASTIKRTKHFAKPKIPLPLTEKGCRSNILKEHILLPMAYKSILSISIKQDVLN